MNCCVEATRYPRSISKQTISDGSSIASTPAAFLTASGSMAHRDRDYLCLDGCVRLFGGCQCLPPLNGIAPLAAAVLAGFDFAFSSTDYVRIDCNHFDVRSLSAVFRLHPFMPAGPVCRTLPQVAAW